LKDTTVNFRAAINRYLIGAGVAVIVLLVAQSRADSAPGLLITPRRVVFEERTRNVVLTLINTGSEAATYRLTFIQMEMTGEGQIAQVVPSPGGAYADSLVRYSPRQVTLEPGTPQTVRLQLRKPGSLAPGEYRSHLLFRALPATDGEDAIGSSSDRDRVEVRIEPVFGVAVPVIVRHGTTEARIRIPVVELCSVSGDATPLSLRVHLARAGNRSVYGDIKVSFTGVDGRARDVGRVNGVAVYVPTASRFIEVPLDLAANLAGQTGRFHIRFEDRGGTFESAEAELTIP
jgi:hypothetical protein